MNLVLVGGVVLAGGIWVYGAAWIAPRAEIMFLQSSRPLQAKAWAALTGALWPVAVGVAVWQKITTGKVK